MRLYRVLTNPNYQLQAFAFIERQLLVDVTLTAAGNISIGAPNFRTHPSTISGTNFNAAYTIKRGQIGFAADEVDPNKVVTAWNRYFGDPNTYPTYSSSLVISKGNRSN